MNFNYIESLVAKAKNGDVSSKEIIFKEFRPMILNISKRIMKKGKINNSQRSAGKIMRELAERFIGKDR